MDSSRSLGELARSIGGTVVGDLETSIADVTHDSRQAGPGSLFVAIRGGSVDGHDYIDQAVRSGASAICVSEERSVGIPQLIAADTRGVLGQLAAEVHGWPSHDIDVIGVTGTNGKTTVTHYIESLMTRSGVRTGLIGTIGTRIGGVDVPTARTTPEASDFQRLLARMRDDGVTKAAVEVSSHALELDRVKATRFAVAAFTNLSQDHLDFHGTMDAYRLAKERLFFEYEIESAVINVDDPVGADLAARIDQRVLSVGRSGEFGYSDLSHHVTGTEFTFSSPSFERRVAAPVHGEFNVSNLVMSLACCQAAGLDLEMVVDHVADVDIVPGRFEIIASGDGGPVVVVDYAHTPEGISKAIETARQVGVGNVIVVFGAGGDRDRAKRPMMGEAGSAADLVVVTSDNPRSEDPDSIISQVAAAVTAPLIRQVDRKVAISEALKVSSPDDIILILGKGHERGQEIGGRVIPFDDSAVAREALFRLRKSANFGPDSGSIRL